MSKRSISGVRLTVPHQFPMSYCYLFSAGTFPNASSWRSNRFVLRKIGSHKQVSCTIGMPKKRILFICMFFEGEEGGGGGEGN